MKIFYHNDPDGQAAAAVVKHFYYSKGWNRSIRGIIGVNYDKKFPYNLIEPNERIYILDYRPDSWDEITEITKNIIWIDHHYTSIEEFKNWAKEKNLGQDYQIQHYTSLNHAGCVLTWMYLFSSAVPLFLKLVEDRDIWKWEFGERTRNFFSGIYLEETDPAKDDNVWDLFLGLRKDKSEELVDIVCNRGKIVSKYIQKKNIQSVSRGMYVRRWEGYRCAVINQIGVGSEVFEDAINVNNFDILVVAYYNGECWMVSLYSTKKLDIHVGEIAKKYGGGGHKGSAGCKFSKEDFPFY